MSENKRIRRRQKAGALSKEQQAFINSTLKNQEQQVQSRTLPVRDNVFDDIELTPSQNRLWTAWKVDPHDNAYNLAGVLTFSGIIDPDKVKKIFTVLLQKHRVLNTNFHQNSVGEVCQRVNSEINFDFIEAKSNVELTLHGLAKKTFDLTSDPLLRVGVFNQGDTCKLLIVMHHIVTDGTSMQQIFNEFIELYCNEYPQNSDPKNVTIQNSDTLDFLDYAQWATSQDNTELLENQKKRWLESLGHDFTPLRLPANNLARRAASYTIATQSLDIDKLHWLQVKELAKRFNVTSYLILLTAFQYLLHRYSDQNDIKIGVPIANRHNAQSIGLVGFFVNTQVIRLEVDEQDSFASLLAQSSKFSSFAQANQDLPFEQLLDEIKPERVNGTHPLFQVMFNFLKRDKRSLTAVKDLQLLDTHALRFTQPFDLQLDVIEDVEYKTTLNFYYAKELYSGEFAKNLLSELSSLLAEVTRSPDEILTHLTWYPQARYDQLTQFINGDKEFKSPVSIPALISKRAVEQSNDIALSFDNKSMSYLEFELASNRLANFLIEQGIGIEQHVGVYLDRSFEMVVALVAILKSGAAYVPLDPNLPKERIDYIAGNSAFSAVLADRENIDFTVPYYIIDAIDLTKYSDEAPDLIIEADQAAYVIYTSGSTGQPKGVINTHGALYNRIAWQQSAYPIGQSDKVLQKTPYGFDVSVWEFFWPLMQGATLVVAEPEIHKEPERLAALIEYQNITVLHFVPSMLQAFISEPKSASCQSIRHLICSGEALPALLQAQTLTLLPNTQVHNLYGPTEAAIDVSYFDCDGDQSKAVPIGKPIAGSALYVLDQYLNLSPIGAVGELFIGGAGLARGYVNRQSHTAERFVANPFSEDGTRLYRSGDLVRWNEAGQLEYLGRTDHQVKIRGLRIELGEIESQLLIQPGVKESVVVAFEGAKGTTHLAAYVSGNQLESAKLQQELKMALPDYMVPSVIILLDSLPLNSNGKVDRKSLPQPQLVDNDKYEPPQGERETLLAQVWQRTLGLEQIGRKDNFFALGGDSILSLQIVAAIRQQGLSFSPKQIFETPTIAQLAEHLVNVSEGEQIQQDVSGDVPLLPIQQTFFSRQPKAENHWNQAVKLTFKKTLDVVSFEQALTAVIKHHDALRLTYESNSNTLQNLQRYQNFEATNYQEILWQQKVSDLDFSADSLQLIEKAQTSLDINTGQVIRAVYTHNTQQYQVVLICHHLVIDGVSWRILVDDLLSGYDQIRQSADIKLTTKSHSYQYWAKQLQQYPEQFSDEFSFWEKQQCSGITLPNWDEQGDASMASADTLNVQLDSVQTNNLLTQANQAYRTQIDDLLLSAVAIAIERWSGCNNAEINLEGHGREPWQANIDLTRTLGWFTSLYPVKLNTKDGLAETVIATKEALRAIPNKGIGFGAFKFYGTEDQQRALRAKAIPQFEFNYLGQLDAVGNDQLAECTVSTEDVGTSISPSNSISAEISINASIQNGQFQLSVTYSRERLPGSDLEMFVNYLQTALDEVISHCKHAKSRLTPTDVPLLSLSQQELDTLPLPEQTVLAAYPLSAMQQGMMFHSLYEKSSAYLNQLRLNMTGLNVSRFQAAWQQVIERHDILRTGFISHEKQTVQYVVAQCPSHFTFHDWQYLDTYEKELDELAITKLNTGFMVTEQIGLMNLVLVQVEDEQHHFIWTYHHMLLDGWSSTALLAEVLTAYQQLPLPEPGGQFKDYLAYLANQDEQIGKAYWQSNLAKLTAPSYLAPVLSAQSDTSVSQDEYAEYALQLSEERAEQLANFAKQQRVTINTLLQGAWSLLLSRLLNLPCVCFGATTSGRPADLVGSEKIIGLFINTLAVISDIKDHQLLGDWLRDLQKESMASREFEHTPLYQIQKWAEADLSFDQQGLFDTLLVFENYPISDTLSQTELGGTRFELIDNREETNFPLTIFVEMVSGININFAYKGSHFSKAAIVYIAEKFDNLLEHMLSSANQLMATVQLLSSDEEIAIKQFGLGQSQAIPELDVIAQIELNTKNIPEAIALKTSDGVSLTYGELHLKVAQVAQYILSLEIELETPIGVCMSRGVDMIVSMLAINVAGGFYVPLDPQLPLERKNYICQHSGLNIVLVNGNVQLPDMVKTFSVYDIQLSAQATNWPVIKRYSQQLAYALYTSGSTGNPKGVAISHENLLNFLIGMQVKLPLAQPINMLALTSLSFDISGLEIYLPLISGGTVTVALGVHELQSNLLSEIDIIQATPSGWRSLLELNLLDSVSGKIALCGGEALPDELEKTLHSKNLRLWNMYGPTETTIWSSCYEVICSPIHLGEAILNTQLYVLDSNLNLCPQQVHGELYIAGQGLARGYLARPDLSAERFVANPFAEDGSRLYRTGDLVRWNAQGELEYLGRTDYQVKIRGYRIELGEIETALDMHSQVRAAVVIADEGPSGTRLVGYVESDVVDSELLRAELAKSLPEYMVPSIIMVLTTLPLNTNGKIDRKALPKADVEVASFVCPQPGLEMQLAKIWQTVLGIEKVGRHDNFFALGGDSINSLRVTALAKSQQLLVPIEAMFTSLDLAQLAIYLCEKPQQIINIPRQKKVYTGLSYAQQRQWFLWKLAPESTAYHISGGLSLQGGLNISALTKALKSLMVRHDSLRTGFVEDQKGEVQQYIAENIELPLQQFDVQGNEDSYQHARTKLLHQPFDLQSAEPLVRLGLLQRSESEYELVMVLHHIIADGWSIKLLINDFVEGYQAEEQGEGANLMSPKLRYSDYAQWQGIWLKAGEEARQLSYWQQQLGTEHSVLALPYDQPFDTENKCGAEYNWQLDGELKNQLNVLARYHGTTLFSVLMAAWQTVLYRYSSEQHIKVGVPIANRHHDGCDDIVGMFVNTQVIATRFTADVRLIDVILQVAENVRGAQANQDLPFEKLIDQLDIPRDTGSTPLFQVMMNHQQVNEDKLSRLAGLELTVLTTPRLEAQFDLSLNSFEDPQGKLNFTLEYIEARFSNTRIFSLKTAFTTVLMALIKTPGMLVTALPILPEKEQQSIQEQGRGISQVDTDSVLEQWQKRVILQGEKQAICHGEQCLSYRALDQRSNQLAQYLITKGVQHEDKVGLVFTRGIEMVVSMLAVMKAGAAYIPLDPSLPIERIEYIVEQSGLTQVVTNTTTALPESVTSWSIDDMSIVEHSDRLLIRSVYAKQLAYILYTSGSTGKPKGVAVTHGNLANFLASMGQEFNCTDADTWLALTSLSFDISGLEIYLPLLQGAEVVIADSVLTVDEAILDQVTHVQATPAGWRSLLEQEVLNKPLVGLCGGEALPESLATALRAKNVCLFNMYGPTETTIWSSYHEVTDRIHLGHAIANTQLYVLDVALNLCQKLVAGELYIAGAGLARGYLERPELTAERFVANPFAEDGSRLYRTGDLVRWNAQGELEYLGRTDHQVKIRGYRIELGEIETALDMHSQVRAAVVIADEGPSGTRLVGYVESDVVDSELLRAELAKSLPEYMVPSIIMVLTTLPLNTNGKIDRKALPKADVEVASFVCPQPGLEMQLAKIWQTVLDIEKVGRHDNFFALGGDSITALRLVSRMNKALDCSITVKDIFTAIDLAALTEVTIKSQVDVDITPLEKVKRYGLMPLSPAQKSLWMTDRMSSKVEKVAYNISGCVALKGKIESKALEAAFNAVIERHENLRTYFVIENEEPGVKVLTEMPFTLSVENVESEQAAEELRSAFEFTVFDLSSGPLIRGKLLILADNHFQLLVSMHHIISDGWSVANLVQELGVFYAKQLGNSMLADSLDVLPVQYLDYASWQNTRLSSHEGEMNKAFWQNSMKEAPPTSILPLHFPRPEKPSIVADEVTFTIHNEVFERLQMLSEIHRVSLFTLLKASYFVYLSQQTGQLDLVLGTDLAGREEADLEPLIGFFIKVLPVRVKLTPSDTFLDLVMRVQQQLLTVQDNQLLTLDNIIQASGVTRKNGTSPLFQQLFVMQNTPKPRWPIDGLDIEEIPNKGITSKFDSAIFIEPNEQGLTGNIVFKRDLYNKKKIQTLIEQWLSLLDTLTLKPTEILPKAQRLSSTKKRMSGKFSKMKVKS